MKLGLLSNLSWLSKPLYNLFLYKNVIQSLGSLAQNVVVGCSVQVKYCSVMEMQLMVSLCTGMFRLFQTSLFSNNLFSRQHLYYQFLVYFRVVGNHAQRVKYLDREDVLVNIDCRATVRSKERYCQVHKSRDREPSRINERKIFKSMKKRTGRKGIKLALRNFTPPSSRFRSIAAHYKMWYVIHHCRSDSFFSSFFCRGLKKGKMQSLRTSDKLVKEKKTQNTSSDHTCHKTCRTLNLDLIFSPNKINSFSTENNVHVTPNSRHLGHCQYFFVARRKLLLSGDIELNPGPSEYLVLTQRLTELGLRLLDVGGDGDCFFKAVSHQLFGTPDSHLAIRHAGITNISNLLLYV